MQFSESASSAFPLKSVAHVPLLMLSCSPFFKTFMKPTENPFTPSVYQVISGRGNNLHEVVTAQGETFLVSMPTKFRKNVWIKRGE